MRVLFCTLPGVGHVFPMISLAWALRGAGHEVLFATSGWAVQHVVKAGLPVSEVSPGADFSKVFSVGDPPDAKGGNFRERGLLVARGGGHAPEMVFERFGEAFNLMADGTAALARRWRPDLVVHGRLQATGLLAARLLDVPVVEHGLNMVREEEFSARYLPYLADGFARNGVPLELPRRQAIHVGPPSTMIGEGDGWFMRYVPYNAGSVIPDWLLEPADRPRVLVTLGTVVPGLSGLGALAPLVESAAGADVEYVLALGDRADLTTLGTLPGNVRAVGWVPLNAVLARCAAIVHHGGAGTTMTALAAGVPQLVMPYGADQFLNADCVSRAGIGLTGDSEKLDATAVDTLLADESIAARAAAVAAESAAQPTPAEIVRRLETL